MPAASKQKSNSDLPTSWRACLLGGAFGVILASAVVLGANASDPRGLGLAAAPFVWNRLVIVNLLAALPLSVALAIRLRNQRLGSPLPPMLVGAALLIVALTSGPAIGKALLWGPWPLRQVWRSLACVVLLLPWCEAGLLEGARRAPSRIANPIGAWHLVLLAVVALCLPGVYTLREMETQSKRASRLIEHEQFWIAYQTVEGLHELGSTILILGRTTAESRDILANRIDQLVADVSKPLPPEVSPPARLQRIGQLVSLDQWGPAQDLARPLSASDERAALWMARIAAHEEDWSGCVRESRSAIRLMQASDKKIEPRPFVQSYELLADGLRREKRYLEAESVLREGLGQTTTNKPDFHFLLGTHYEMAGRHWEAAAQLEQAAELDHDFREPAAAMLRRMSLDTPACLLRPSKMAIR